MKAIVALEKGNWPKYKEINIVPASETWQKVEVLSSAINHRDLWICKGQYPMNRFPVVLGSDACVQFNGAEYVVLPGLGWGENEDFQGQDYTIFGSPLDGTFGEKMYVPEFSLHKKPKHLSHLQAAALPLAGLTAYRALFKKGKIQPDHKVLINGIGGGVALFAFQFALALGAEVWVSSSSEEKLNKAIKMGAAGAKNYTNPEWTQDLITEAGLFDIILDSAGGKGFGDLIKAAAPGSRLVIYGGGNGKINGLSPQVLFWRQISIHGTTMGSQADFAAMLEFVEEHRITPIVDSIYSLKDFKEAFGRMDRAEQFGKLVFDHSK